MTPYYDDGTCTIYHADCLTIWPEWDRPGAVMVTDPPYGRRFIGNQSQTGPTRPIAGDDDPRVRDAALALWRGRPALVFGTWQIERPRGVRHVLIWDKANIGMGDLAFPWGPGHEEIYVLGYGYTGTRRTSVLRVQTQNGFDTSKQRAWGTFHPTAKPVPLLRALIDCCPPGATIVDPFTGSGTTLRAAKDLGRRAVGVEIEEAYCEQAANRLAQEVLPLEPPAEPYEQQASLL